MVTWNADYARKTLKQWEALAFLRFRLFEFSTIKLKTRKGMLAHVQNELEPQRDTVVGRGLQINPSE